MVKMNKEKEKKKKKKKTLLKVPTIKRNQFLKKNLFIKMMDSTLEAYLSTATASGQDGHALDQSASSRRGTGTLSPG